MFHVQVLTDTIVPIADMSFSVLFSVSTVRSTPSPLAIIWYCGLCCRCGSVAIRPVDSTVDTQSYVVAVFQLVSLCHLA